MKSGNDINVPVISTYNVHECSTNLYSSCSTNSRSCSINSFSRASTSKQNDSSNSFITMAYRPSPLLWHPRLVTFWVPVRPQTWPDHGSCTQQSSNIVSCHSVHRPATYGTARLAAALPIVTFFCCSEATYATWLCTYALLCRHRS